MKQYAKQRDERRQQRDDAIAQIRDCLENGAEDSILGILSDEQIQQLAEDHNEGRD